ncbi:MAG: hypothetical protein V3T05_06685 [Myxococcota bacterium]
MPNAGELGIILAMVTIIVVTQRLSRLGDALGAALHRLFPRMSSGDPKSESPPDSIPHDD